MLTMERVLLAEIARHCKNWFEEKFNEFLQNEQTWIQNYPGRRVEIQQRVSHLRRVKDRIWWLLVQLEQLKDSVF